MAEYLAFGALLNAKTFFDLVFVCLATETGSHDSILLIRARVGHPWD